MQCNGAFLVDTNEMNCKEKMSGFGLFLQADIEPDWLTGNVSSFSKTMMEGVYVLNRGLKALIPIRSHTAKEKPI